MTERLNASLTHTHWRLLSFDTAAASTLPLAAAPITLSFTEEEGFHRLNGSGGCNRYFADYEIAGDHLHVGPIGATRMMCPDPDQMAQEARYCQALEAAERFERQNGELIISYTGGTLRFVAADERAEPARP
jgi:heat shock protein HslJ